MKTGLIILCAVLTTVASSAQGTLEVIVKNISPQKGTVHVGLFRKEKDFPKAAEKGKISTVVGNEVRVVFENIENGDYAISVFHDANENNELDTNMVGIPREGFAFGNNAMGTFGPPSFDRAKVTISNNTLTQELVLKYY